jgi:catechol 2,3-dioxygenase-like lactoylglutathione lyase family enzyme
MEPRPAIIGLLGDYERGSLSRRQLVARLCGIVAAAAAVPALGQAERSTAGGATFTATDLNHLALRVTDVDRSTEFYRRHLGMTVTSRSPTACFLSCSERDFLALFRGERAGLDHFCFSVPGYSAGAATATLEAAGLAPRRQGDRVYFDDPDGLEVQVSSRDDG